MADGVYYKGREMLRLRLGFQQLTMFATKVTRGLD